MSSYDQEQLIRSLRETIGELHSVNSELRHRISELESRLGEKTPSSGTMPTETTLNDVESESLTHKEIITFNKKIDTSEFRQMILTWSSDTSRYLSQQMILLFSNNNFDGWFGFYNSLASGSIEFCSYLDVYQWAGLRASSITRMKDYLKSIGVNVSQKPPPNPEGYLLAKLQKTITQSLNDRIRQYYNLSLGNPPESLVNELKLSMVNWDIIRVSEELRKLGVSQEWLGEVRFYSENPGQYVQRYWPEK